MTPAVVSTANKSSTEASAAAAAKPDKAAALRPTDFCHSKNIPTCQPAMFGFLNPLCRTKKYRQLYCDSCSHMRQNYGQWSTPFLSYEAVLAHAMAYDAGLISEEDIVTPCRLIPAPKRPKATSDTHRRLRQSNCGFTIGTPRWNTGGEGSIRRK